MHKELLFSVKAFGAVGDKITDDAAAIQRAIDACHEAGGGVVYVGPGEYMTSALHLKSYVTLYLEAGAPFWKRRNLPWLRARKEILSCLPKTVMRKQALM